jgi:plasmid maintenance system antidote protein VapI
MTTGAELRAERERAEVKLVDVARAMGVQHPRVSHIEALASVTKEAAARYRKALQTVISGESSEAVA